MFLKLVYSFGFLKLALTARKIYLQKANPKTFQPNFLRNRDKNLKVDT